MSSQAPEMIVCGVAAVPRSDIEDALCAAFKDAVEEWCARPDDNKGSFNSQLFKYLKKSDGARGTNYAANIAREVPLVFGGAAGAAGATASSLVKAGATGAAGAAAALLHGNYTSISSRITGGVSNWLSGANQAAGQGVVARFALGETQAARDATRATLSRIAPGTWNRFPDGLIPPKQLIEIKGPGDEFNPGQKEDYDRFSKPGSTIVVDCVKCDAPCVNEKGAADNGCL